MAATCDYCHKPLGLVRRLRGEKFCSVEHLDLYAAQQAEIALERLAASVEDEPVPLAPKKLPRIHPQPVLSALLASELTRGADAVEVAEPPVAGAQLVTMPASDREAVETAKRDYPLAGFLAQPGPAAASEPLAPAPGLAVPSEGWGENGRATRLPALRLRPQDPREWSEPELLAQVPPVANWRQVLGPQVDSETSSAGSQAGVHTSLPSANLLHAGQPGDRSPLLRAIGSAPVRRPERAPRPGAEPGVAPVEPATAGLHQLPLPGHPEPRGLGCAPIALAPSRLGLAIPFLSPAPCAWSETVVSISLPGTLARLVPGLGLAAARVWQVAPVTPEQPSAMAQLAWVWDPQEHAWPLLWGPRTASLSLGSHRARLTPRPDAASAASGTGLAAFGDVAGNLRVEPVLALRLAAAPRPAKVRAAGSAPVRWEEPLPIEPFGWAASCGPIRLAPMPRPALESERSRMRRALRPQASPGALVEPSAPLRCAPPTLTAYPKPGFVLWPLALPRESRFAFQDPWALPPPEALSVAGYRPGGPYPKLPQRLPDRFLRLKAPGMAPPFRKAPWQALRSRRDWATSRPPDLANPVRLHAADYFRWPEAWPASDRSTGLQRYSQSADGWAKVMA